MAQNKSKRRRQLNDCAGTVEIPVTAAARQGLERLLATGLYGTHVCEVAQRIIDRFLAEEVYEWRKISVPK